MKRVLFLTLLMIGLGITLGYGPYLVMRARRCDSWPSVEGTVLASDSERASGRKGRHLLRIRYEYQVADQLYENNSIWPDGPRSVDHAASFMALYPPGSKHPVYYDPASPDDAVLLREGTSRGWLTLALGMLIVTAAGVGLRRQGGT